MIKSINKVKFGDIVAKAVESSSGQLLFAKGTILEQKHIDILKKFNILEINIADEPEIKFEDIPEDVKDKAKEFYGAVMDWQPEHFLEKELYEIALFNKAKQIYVREKNNA